MEAHHPDNKPRSSKSYNANHEIRIVRVETVIEHIQYMLDRIDKRFDAMENQLANRSIATDVKIDVIEGKIDSTIKWMVGIGVTSLISVFGAIINIALKLNS